MTRCDSIRRFFDDNFGMGCLLFLCLIATATTFLIGKFAGNDTFGLFSGMPDDEFMKNKETLKKISRRSFLLSCFMAILIFTFQAIASFVPTTKEMCAIAVIPKIANSESVQTIGSEIVDLAKDWLRELHPAKEENGKKDKKPEKDSKKKDVQKADKESGK